MAYIPPYEGQNIACTVLRIERSSIHGRQRLPHGGVL